MTIATDDALMLVEILESLERLMFEAVGMTAIALSIAAAGELTIPQWRALVVIGREDGPRIGDIAAAVGMSLPSTSRMVRRLERNGLVTTMRDETDRRATNVRMTLKGRDIRQKVVQCRRSMMEEALAAHAPRLPRGLVAGLATISAAFEPYE
jgi:DNA-binding MarR family transcriptional regulator